MTNFVWEGLKGLIEEVNFPLGLEGCVEVPQTKGVLRVFQDDLEFSILYSFF